MPDLITAQKFTRQNGGLLDVPIAATSTMEYINAGGRAIKVFNNGGPTTTMTVTTPNVIDADLAIDDFTADIADTETRYIGPFTAKDYNDIDGLIQIQFSSITNITVSVVGA